MLLEALPTFETGTKARMMIQQDYQLEPVKLCLSVSDSGWREMKKEDSVLREKNSSNSSSDIHVLSPSP